MLGGGTHFLGYKYMCAKQMYKSRPPRGVWGQNFYFEKVAA